MTAAGVQRRLKALGFATPVTGKFGDGDPPRHHQLAIGARLSVERLPEQVCK